MQRWVYCARILLVAGLLFAFLPRAQGASFTFRQPTAQTYRLEETRQLQSHSGGDWIPARSHDGQGVPVELGSRIALKVQPGVDLTMLLRGVSVSIARDLAPDLVILEAGTALKALELAQALSERSEVVAAYPVMRRFLTKHNSYAATPNDPRFSDQWNLEYRDIEARKLGEDLNARAAWPCSRGAGVTLAIVDDGVELSHPEFRNRSTQDMHYNFVRHIPDGAPADFYDNHGTAVAGLAAAEGNNAVGITGVAPEVRLVSWKIFESAIGYPPIASDDQLAEMFQSHSNIVAVQNHSWGNAYPQQLGPTLLEDEGIAAAVGKGRDGKGVVIVRAVANGRDTGIDANDDGYASDPRAIAVGAVRADGRATSYSSRGASLLVVAPGGDSDREIITTDREGSSNGFNRGFYVDDSADYVMSADTRGTSFATPQISGLAALLLSCNPELSYRDVQQILLLSARPGRPSDVGVATNGAGLRVSHDVGFGIPDAGQALRLAAKWPPRPRPMVTQLAQHFTRPIVDDGLRVVISGPSVPAELMSIPSTPSLGEQANQPTGFLSLVDLGYATNVIDQDLSGKGALIERGPAGEFADERNFFVHKIARAAEAGAEFAVVMNNEGTDARIVMGLTDYSPIPALMISRNAGLALRAYREAHPEAKAAIEPLTTRYDFVVPQALVCEHVGVRLRTTHARRGDLRITLTSPQGTVSILQRPNQDASPGPTDWTYYSTHHFYESSRGNWRVDVLDEEALADGEVTAVELILHGVPIADLDADGLDDNWERSHFESLDADAPGDPDQDGYSNAVEQILGTDPTGATPLRLAIDAWDASRARLSWSGVGMTDYEVLFSPQVGFPHQPVAIVPGNFPQTEWIAPLDRSTNALYQIRQLP